VSTSQGEIMKGDPKVIEHLNLCLKRELTAINQYFLHAKMCENWGYHKLAAYMKKESIEEMMHADLLMQRILFLEGVPNMMDMYPIPIGTTVKEQLENDFKLEEAAIPALNEAIAHAASVGDNGSRELFKQILLDEEHHYDWLEAQFGLMEEVGMQNYLASWLGQPEA
jgi:bacterioferritin